MPNAHSQFDVVGVTVLCKPGVGERTLVGEEPASLSELLDCIVVLEAWRATCRLVSMLLTSLSTGQRDFPGLLSNRSLLFHPKKASSDARVSGPPGE